MRHPLVQGIVKAYEAYREAEAGNGSAPVDHAAARRRRRAASSEPPES